MTDWVRGRGRMGRVAYLVSLVLVVVFGGIGAVVAASTGIDWLAGLPVLIAGLATLPLTSRRLHDMNKPALHLVWIVGGGIALGLLAARMPGSEPVNTVFGVAVTAWLLLVPGTRGANAYGMPPVARAASGSDTTWNDRWDRDRHDDDRRRDDDRDDDRGGSDDAGGSDGGGD